MATRVGGCGICLTSFNSLTPKIACCGQYSPRCLPHKPSYCLFCRKFCCHGNRGQSW